MSATAEAPPRTEEEPTERPRLTREQTAERVFELLTDEPQSMAALRRQLLGPNANRSTHTDFIRDGLGVLEAQRRATRVPSRGWTRFHAATSPARAKTQDISFEEQWAFIDIEAMFVDPTYQRPITNFVERIQQRFNPLLFQLLALSDRGAKHKPHRYAIIDGQTRWQAARRLGIKKVPCVIYKGLTPQDEAKMFADLQKERRGMATWHRFRAALAAKDEEALSIKELVEATGYEIGDREGQIKAIAALESCFRKDEFLLGRVLTDFKAAWPDVVPEDVHIRGLHRFFRGYPFPPKGAKKPKVTPQVDDGKLITRLKTAGPEGLKRKYSAVKEGGTVKGGNDLQMANAVLGIYK